MRRSLVTGGAGVIGQRLVEQLIKRGESVRVVDRLPRPSDMNDAVDYTQGDIVDIGADLIADFDPHVIFHLAAAFERSEENPEFWLENAHDNVAASSQVLLGSLRSPSLERYVFASSYLIYDPDQYLSAEPRATPVDLREDSAIDPRNACGAAKFLHEKEIELATHSPSVTFTTVSARIYRVYGRSSRDIVSRWIRAAIDGQEISVYGEDSIFDYVLADDVAEGLARLANSEASGVVNLASGASRSVRDLVACLESHFPDLAVAGPHPSEVYESSQASLDRLVEFTGWKPESSLEFGVSQLVAHERSHAAAGTVSARVLPSRQVNILISSVSRKASLVKAARQSVRSLSATGTIWGADAAAAPPAASLVDQFWQMPRLDAMEDSVLIDFCRDNAISVLVPTRDGELHRYAEMREQLAAVGTFVPIGSVESVDIAVDKLRFAEHMSKNGLPNIATALGVDDLDATTFVVKPRHGAGSASLHLGLDREGAMALLEQNEDVIVQPMVEGDEYSIDVYLRQDGSPVGAVPRRRVSVEGGESTVTTTVNDPALAELGIGCATAVGVRGHAVVQAIVTNGQAQLLECNSRVGGASNAAFTAGLRSFDAMVLESFGQRPPDAVIRYDVTLTRLPTDRFAWR